MGNGLTSARGLTPLSSGLKAHGGGGNSVSSWFAQYSVRPTVEALHVRGFCLAIELNRGSVYRRSNVRALVSSVSFQASRLVRKSPGYRFWGNQEKPLRCHNWTTFTQHRMRKEPLDIRHLQEALAFYRSVRAARYVRQGEALLAVPSQLAGRAARL